jgi:hypothetical protein
LTGAAFEAPAVLLSDVTSSTKLEHVCEFQNLTAAPACVHIENIPCGCLLVWSLTENRQLKKDDSLILTPNGKQAIKFSFSVAPTPELQSHSAQFVVDGAYGREEPLSVRMCIRVLADLVVTPPVLSHAFVFSDPLLVEKTITIRRIVRSEGEPKLGLRLGRLPPDVELTGLVDKGGAEAEGGIWIHTWEAGFALTRSDRLTGTFASGFDVLFDGPQVASRHVPVTLRKQFGIEMKPGTCDFGSVPRAESRSRKMLLVAADEKPFSIEGADSSSPEVAVAVDRSKAATRHWVELTARPAKKGEWQAEIRFRTTHPEARTLTLPVRGRSP